ncbi:hypothetical protein CVV38_01210 [Candidatus Peregrinibacteria bacterium HGW-Peregrinibacteria-1]|jgi:hypothetical protein|nr:MAG: hypothetical protein CVV38_01210 [Candidatus Peregrinibacteria bacterium HGW-Peregrinibacteria-1]
MTKISRASIDEFDAPEPLDHFDQLSHLTEGHENTAELTDLQLIGLIESNSTIPTAARLSQQIISGLKEQFRHITIVTEQKKADNLTTINLIKAVSKTKHSADLLELYRSEDDLIAQERLQAAQAATNHQIFHTFDADSEPATFYSRDAKEAALKARRIDRTVTTKLRELHAAIKSLDHQALQQKLQLLRGARERNTQ